MSSQVSHFTVLTEDQASFARRGRLQTAHGAVETPVFMPVGTQATVKGMTPAQIRATGASIILGNTYHLNLRPGPERIRKLGGLHRFMGWEGPILTDSGGFQAFSLAELREITDAGIAFKSHLDGSACFLGPREVMDIQAALGSDIAMVIDVCPAWPTSQEDAREAVRRTLLWAESCREIYREEPWKGSGRHCFGIVQGSTFPELRKACAEALVDMDFPGYAIGGLSVGESPQKVLEQAEWTAPQLPFHKPRYAMGLGRPPELLQLIARGVDMFDCVMPTRAARHGTAFTEDGPINLKNARFAEDESPLDASVTDKTRAGGVSRAYVRHLLMAGESLGGTLLTIHNLRFYGSLLREARVRLQKGDFLPWSTQWCERYGRDAGTI